MADWQVCNQCGGVVADWTLHTAWHLAVSLTSTATPVIATPPAPTQPTGSA